MMVNSGGERCTCGQRGCLETYASASAILRRYKARGGTRAITTEQIPPLLADDRSAAAVWSEAIEALAQGISALTAIFDPEEIIIGGGLSLAGPALLDPLRAATSLRLGWRDAPPISLSTATSRAGLHGAGLMAGTVLSPEPRASYAG
ncbi:ROK family protein [Arthrobacter sp. ISL-72]|nr:ROK family protein [Arthrobacter sp. ISL-72]